MRSIQNVCQATGLALSLLAGLAGMGCGRPVDTLGTSTGHGGSGGATATSSGHGGAGGINLTTTSTSTSTSGTGGIAGGCAGGDTQSCYTGDPATKDVGACHAGTQTCIDGAWSPCSGAVLPAPESCNGQDDDCNGAVDDGFAPVTCGVGACQVTVAPCVGGQPVACVPLPPMPELCNGIDDNCDGQIDESCACIDGTTQPCYSGPSATQHVGVCADGTQTCAGGQWGACTGDVVPSPETCDGKDNDCDGAVDNGNPGGGATCNTGKPGVCGPALVKCVNGTLFCTQTTQPSPEVCDGLDNDCDGTVDNGNPGGGTACNTGMPGSCAVGATSCIGGALGCKATQGTPEVCDGVDNDCDGVVDNGNPGGGFACNTGKFGACGLGTATCTGGSVLCVQNVQPTAEVCDGKDNDCDGVVDNGNPGGGAACSTGKPGTCATGTTVCTGSGLVCNQNVQPTAEACDGKDNDCDGQIDNGNPGGGVACATGKPGVCNAGVSLCSGGAMTCAETVQPTAEICDGLDNDCDGVVDNGNPGGGSLCNTGKPGVCSIGTMFCGAGSLKCVQNVQSGPELCDGLDNNCDGQVDEGNPGGGAACNTGKPGVCAAGTISCVGGVLKCVQTVQPSAEVCDGKDNDCDGVVDDGNPGGGALCNTGKLGVCANGTTTCQGGVLTCSQTVQPSAEVCDARDNNCNGQVDEGNPCSCAHSRCVVGTALTSGCDAPATSTTSCVQKVCATDAFCCTTTWDSNCVNEVTSICGLTTCY